MPIEFVDADIALQGFGSAVDVSIDNGAAADRFVAMFLNGINGVPESHNSAVDGSLGLTQVGTTAVDPNSGLVVEDSFWSGVAAPTGVQTATGTFAGIDITAAVVVATYAGVNQTTPHGNVYVGYTLVDTPSEVVQATVADSLAGDKILAFVRTAASAGTPTATSSGETRAANTAEVLQRIWVFEFTAASDGATVSATIAVAGGAQNVAASIHAAKLIATEVPQVLAPTSDVAAGAWLPSSGGTLAGVLDESSASDADYAYTPSASTFTVAVAPGADPASSTGHIVRYRINAANGRGMVVRLMQGVTQIASWTHAPAPAVPTTFAQTLSGAEADSITDYTALRLQFEATS